MQPTPEAIRQAIATIDEVMKLHAEKRDDPATGMLRECYRRAVYTLNEGAIILESYLPRAEQKLI